MKSMVPDAPRASRDGADLKPLYLESLSLVERLHRRLLDTIKDEFDRSAIHDLNSAQALILFNIGESKMEACELRRRGYYLGSSVSYNLKKLSALGYINHEPSRSDRRSNSISLTGKGRNVAEIVDRLYERHVRGIDQISDALATADIHKISRSLRRLDRFLTDQIQFRL